MQLALIYVTHESRENDRKQIDTLIREKVIACGNIFPIECLYWWNNAMEDGGEYVSILKTIPALWEKAKSNIEQIHPYEVPCIIKIDAHCNEAYYNWIKRLVQRDH